MTVIAFKVFGAALLAWSVARVIVAIRERK